jgi:hypothetical protein
VPYRVLVGKPKGRKPLGRPIPLLREVTQDRDR